MKRLLQLSLVTGILFCACTGKKAGILNTSNLTSHFINIDAGKDNVLKTPKGATIKIAAKTFDVPTGTRVSIEIKEAYSMQDVLKAGLTTVSNGRLLQSGGMIYFNATADSKAVPFLKPVSISIPSKTYNDSMKVFKGEISSDSTINWVEPKQLDTNEAAGKFITGKALFKANCASCHKTYLEATGPMLAGSRDREPNKEWAYMFVNNVNAVIEKDSYARVLKAKYGSVMSQFNLKKEEIKAILDYADNDARANRPGIFLKDSVGITPETAPGCGYDTIPVFKEAGIELTGTDTAGVNADTSLASQQTFTYGERPSYIFSIDESGWYNIDCFIYSNRDLVSDVILTASVKNAGDKVLDVYLCIPDRKVLSHGVDSEDGFVFYEKQTKMIKGDDAFVYVLGLKKEKYYYGITRFRVKDEQHLVVDLKESTAEEIKEDLRKNRVGNSVQIDKDEPVIEAFINVNRPDSTKNSTDSSGSKIEMQIQKRNCSGDSIPVPAIAAVGYH